MSVCGSEEVDLLYWNEESCGNYTVRSAYRLLQRQKGAWDTSDGSSIWKLLWRIEAPPKVLNLVWRALSQCLPTKTALYAKRVPVSVVCPVCNEDQEIVIHALVSFPFAKLCWRKRGRVCRVSTDTNFDIWLRRMLSITDKEEHGEIVTLCWNIWQARNNMLWNQKKGEVNFVVFSTRQYLADWRNAQGMSTKALYRDVESGDGAISWVKPKKDVVKITVDAALFAEISTYGIGLLARDDKGEVYTSALKLVRSMLPLHYLKVGYLTAPPARVLVAPHGDWKRSQFVLNQEGLRQISSAKERQMPGRLSNAKDEENSHKSSLVEVKVANIVSVSPCADLTLPAGPALCVDTIHGSFFLVMDQEAVWHPTYVL